MRRAVRRRGSCGQGTARKLHRLRAPESGGNRRAARPGGDVTDRSGAGTVDVRRVDAYDYDLPDELIARAPAAARDAARLLVMGSRGGVAHRTFAEFPALLRPGDVLVVNETRVIRARLRGTREGGGAAEILLLHPADDLRFDPAARRWHALVRPGRRLRDGAKVAISPDDAVRIERREGETWIVRFESELSAGEILERYGEVPLPPYIGEAGRPYEERYQTVFAKTPGSVAAPTASLHFTDRVLAEIRGRGVEVVPLTLDVGLGTFRPISAASIDEHVLHAERYDIPAATAAAVEAARSGGRRVVAAGTTVIRALETAAMEGGSIRPGAGVTQLYVTPGFRFRVTNAVLTNFHLPRSTLLVLVCAFAGHEAVLHAYEEAVRARYRFFSFGDAMFAERGTGDSP